MPIGYSDDVRLRELTKAAKAKLDILTAKLGQVKREFEQAEVEYNDLVAQQRRLTEPVDLYAPTKKKPSTTSMKREDN